MKRFIRHLAITLVLLSMAWLSGCVSCLPQYVAPPYGPVSACYPMGHDPFVPSDHNPSPLNPYDFISSMASPFLYGPPR